MVHLQLKSYLIVFFRVISPQLQILLGSNMLIIYDLEVSPFNSVKSLVCATFWLQHYCQISRQYNHSFSTQQLCCTWQLRFYKAGEQSPYADLLATHYMSKLLAYFKFSTASGRYGADRQTSRVKCVMCDIHCVSKKTSHL